MLGLQKKHGYDSIVFYAKRGTRNFVFDQYATPGFAQEFLGIKDNPTESGKLIKSPIERSYQGCLIFIIFFSFPDWLIFLVLREFPFLSKLPPGELLLGFLVQKIHF